MHFSNQEPSLILSSEEILLFLTKLYTERAYSGKLICVLYGRKRTPSPFPMEFLKKTLTNAP